MLILWPTSIRFLNRRVATHRTKKNETNKMSLVVKERFVDQRGIVFIVWKAENPNTELPKPRDLYEAQNGGVDTSKFRVDKISRIQAEFECRVCDNVKLASVETLRMHLAGNRHVSGLRHFHSRPRSVTSTYTSSTSRSQHRPLHPESLIEVAKRAVEELEGGKANFAVGLEYVEEFVLRPERGSQKRQRLYRCLLCNFKADSAVMLDHTHEEHHMRRAFRRSYDQAPAAEDYRQEVVNECVLKSHWLRFERGGEAPYKSKSIRSHRDWADLMQTTTTRVPRIGLSRRIKQTYREEDEVEIKRSISMTSISSRTSTSRQAFPVAPTPIR